MGKGTLYGVGVGPGDPQLLTLKAVETIRKCPVVAAPRTKNGAMVALDIVQGAMDLADKTVLGLDFTMSHDKSVRQASHQAAAARLMALLDTGKDVAMLNLGDVSIYASYQYIHTILKQAGYPVQMVPGIPSFCAAATTLGESLTEMGTPVFIIPAGAALADTPHTQQATRIYMKSGNALPALLKQLEAENRLNDAMAVQNCGMENERVIRDLRGVELSPDYFSLVIVKGGADEG